MQTRASSSPRFWYSVPARPSPRRFRSAWSPRLEENRNRQDRALQRPLHGAVPRAVLDAAGADGGRQRPKPPGAQPILVFADEGPFDGGSWSTRSIDIVGGAAGNIEVAGSGQGILGSAVIKGHATEVIDVGHFLPMAFADWFTRKEMRPSATAQSVLLVDDSAFFRNMLAPVLKAAGYRVRVAPNAQEGLIALRSGQSFDAVLTDIEMPDMNGFEFAETIRADQHLSSMPIIGLSSAGLAGRDRAWTPGRLPRLRRQVRPSGPDRGAEGTNRRDQPGGMNKVQPGHRNV